MINTRKLHNILRNAKFVNCTNPAHHERGYYLKDHTKGFSVINIFFNSHELLDEAHLLLQANQINNEKNITQGCFLSIKYD